MATPGAMLAASSAVVVSVCWYTSRSASSTVAGEPCSAGTRAAAGVTATIRSGTVRRAASVAAHSTARKDSSEPSAPTTIGLVTIALPPSGTARPPARAIAGEVTGLGATRAALRPACRRGKRKS